MADAARLRSQHRRPPALVRGAGHLASAGAVLLVRAGFAVAMTEIAAPTARRRAVSFPEHVYEDRTMVKDLEGVLAGNVDDAEHILRKGAVPALVDPEARVRFVLRPDMVVDAVMAKRNLGISMSDAPFMVALGPGFIAGRDAHSMSAKEAALDVVSGKFTDVKPLPCRLPSIIP